MIPRSDADPLAAAEALLARRDERALAAFYFAERAGADPDRCAAGRWAAQMLTGNFSGAWMECDAIRRRGAPDPNRFWDGQPIDDRRVIVRCLHGLGDAIQFLRYLPQLRARAASVVVEVPPRLYELASYIAGVEQVITWAKPSPIAPVAWEVQIEVMELPYLFRTTLRDLPIAENYLCIPSRSVYSSTFKSQTRPRVGLVWGAGDWNPQRSLPFSFARRLVLNSNCEFWSLQGGPKNDRWKGLAKSEKYRDAGELGDGLMNLAALVKELDLVITVDTLAAHLAGAMGKPAWVLLTHAADWRWMANRADTPWYPSLRLFRQPSPGDWHALIETVQEELQTWTRKLDQQTLTA